MYRWLSRAGRARAVLAGLEARGCEPGTATAQLASVSAARRTAEPSIGSASRGGTFAQRSAGTILGEFTWGKG